MKNKKDIKESSKSTTKEKLLKSVTGRLNKFGQWRLSASSNDTIVIKDMRAVLK
jgi:hypothetical protein